MTSADARLGVMLPNGCRVTHGNGGNIKAPFDTIPIRMHELYVRPSASEDGPYEGPFGFMPFEAGHRLPRHLHLAGGEDGRHLVAERTLVADGVGLTEVNGKILLAAAGTLIHVPPGVPHSWTACPAGIVLPDGTVSTGHFLMVYEYAEPTGFYPVESTSPLASASDYASFIGDLETIRFPQLSLEQVIERAAYVWGKEVRSDLRLAG